MKINLKEIKQIAKSRFINSISCHDWDHVMRVYLLAVVLAKKEKADMAVVKTAALLHDIKRAEEMLSGGNFCHALEGAKEAEKILQELGYDKDFTLAVKHAIEAHRYRNNIKPNSLEAKILSDADKLDALGAIGVGRGFLWCGRHGSRLHNTDKKSILANSPHDKNHTLYTEYMVKLRFLKNKMFTESGRKIAQERTAFMTKFLKRLDSEVKGKL
ncbi:HD domain-containing protein [Patescibacteria group bacterium]|nr:HD domain-containing protein [Patescibacteria group bacterium]